MNAPSESEHLIVLATNTDDPALAFRQLRRFGNGSDFTCELHIRAHGFVAQRPFYFSERSFRSALDALRYMHRELTGKARFEEEWEHDQFLQFAMASSGHVIVSGRLVLLSGEPNELSFTFQTDQTCLGPFIHALEQFDDEA
jgi:hypothetical protein